MHCTLASTFQSCYKHYYTQPREVTPALVDGKKVKGKDGDDLYRHIAAGIDSAKRGEK